MNYSSAYLGRNGLWLFTNLISIDKRNTKTWSLLIEKGMEKERNYFPYLNTASVEFQDNSNYATIKGITVVAEIPETFETSEENKKKYIFEENECYQVDSSFISKNKVSYLKNQFHLCRFCVEKPNVYEAIVPYTQIIRLEKGGQWELFAYLKVLNVL